MFDRIKNILKSELSDFMDKMSDNDGFNFNRRSTYQKEEEDYSNIDDIYEKEFGSKSQEPSITPEERKHYQALELPVGTSFEQIKASYKKLIKKYHPDRHQNDPKKHKTAMAITQKLNMAYNYFKDKYEK